MIDAHYEVDGGVRPKLAVPMQRRTPVRACGASLLPLAPAQAAVPEPTAINLVTATPAKWDGHDCLAVELTAAEQALRLTTQCGGNRPSLPIVAPAIAAGGLEA